MDSLDCHPTKNRLPDPIRLNRGCARPGPGLGHDGLRSRFSNCYHQRSGGNSTHIVSRLTWVSKRIIDECFAPLKAQNLSGVTPFVLSIKRNPKHWDRNSVTFQSLEDANVCIDNTCPISQAGRRRFESDLPRHPNPRNQRSYLHLQASPNQPLVSFVSIRRRLDGLLRNSRKTAAARSVPLPYGAAPRPLRFKGH